MATVKTGQLGRISPTVASAMLKKNTAAAALNGTSIFAGNKLYKPASTGQAPPRSWLKSK